MAACDLSACLLLPCLPGLIDPGRAFSAWRAFDLGLLACFAKRDIGLVLHFSLFALRRDVFVQFALPIDGAGPPDRGFLLVRPHPATAVDMAEVPFTHAPAPQDGSARGPPK